jgi:Tfp pilus assembly protein PilF
MSSHRRWPVVVVAVFSLWASLAPAQRTGIGETGKDGVIIQVRVVHANDHPAQEQLRVDLLSGSGMVITAMFTNSNGMAIFANLPGGDYRLRVSGPGIEETVTGSFYIDARARNHTERVVVRPSVSSPPVVETGPSVAVVDLKVPKPARQAVDKGVNAFNEGKFDEARQHFEKAIETYPSYATAYNMLGLTFLKQRERQQGQQAFEKAIELNDNFADAYMNLAKIHFHEQKYSLSAPLLEKSIAAEPRNPEALTYLTQLELLGNNYEKAAAYARRVHELPHQEYAIVHFMAARALRALNRRSDAVAEYKLFLQEAAGKHANSSLARQELAQLENNKP